VHPPALFFFFLFIVFFFPFLNPPGCASSHTLWPPTLQPPFHFFTHPPHCVFFCAPLFVFLHTDAHILRSTPRVTRPPPLVRRKKYLLVGSRMPGCQFFDICAFPRDTSFMRNFFIMPLFTPLPMLLLELSPPLLLCDARPVGSPQFCPYSSSGVFVSRSPFPFFFPLRFL